MFESGGDRVTSGNKGYILLKARPDGNKSWRSGVVISERGTV